MSVVQDKADHYLQHETAFRLGVLPTEQPHPNTRGLAETLRQDTAAGVRMLQSVDQDLEAVAARSLGGDQWLMLVEAMSRCLRCGGRIFFTGCGATGRLSILLEAMWRRFWLARGGSDAAVRADQVRSVMAGGDFALIRSVEGFEDFADFGRRQLQDTGVARGDVVVAITEGGETSFVIGTAWEALACGARTFFVFNNPAEVLAKHVQRSREVIQESRIVKLDLSAGPMAVAGSTRMQATTVELLVVGAALDAALAELLGAAASDPTSIAGAFSALLRDLERDDNVSTFAHMVEAEETVYRKHGLVTYFADHCLLDVLTDTTERSPTFSLPPFRERDDPSAAPSWSFVKTPICTTGEAWPRMLGRSPRGVNWNGQTYRDLKAPPLLQRDPPTLTSERILRFGVGNEPDPSRTDVPASLAIAVLAGNEIETHLAARHPFRFGFLSHAASYQQAACLTVGSAPPARLAEEVDVHHIQCDLPGTLLGLWPRLAVKLVLNTLSTATMGRIGRLVSNWMVYVSTSNKKLIDRGIRLIAEQTGVDYDRACHELFLTLEEMPPLVAGSRAMSPVAATIERLRAGSLQ